MQAIILVRGMGRGKGEGLCAPGRAAWRPVTCHTWVNTHPHACPRPTRCPALPFLAGRQTVVANGGQDFGRTLLFFFAGGIAQSMEYSGGTRQVRRCGGGGL